MLMQLLLKSYQSTLSVIVYRLTLGDSVVTVLLNGSANWLPQFIGSAARPASPGERASPVTIGGRASLS